MPDARLVYWDASAILSVLTPDDHTEQAVATVEMEAIHVVSSLADAEVAAVLGRSVRRQLLDRATANQALDRLERPPWRRSTVTPRPEVVRAMSRRHALRGADLWHVAAAITLSLDVGEVIVASFDTELTAAASAEGITVAD
jgi:predicted nucleic acid-binding protein